MPDEHGGPGRAPVTEAMIEAGMYALELCIAEQTSLQQRVARIYEAMEEQQRADA